MDPIYEEAVFLRGDGAAVSCLWLHDEEPRRTKAPAATFKVEWDRVELTPGAAARAERRLVGALAKLLDGEGP